MKVKPAELWAKLHLSYTDIDTDIARTTLVGKNLVRGASDQVYTRTHELENDHSQFATAFEIVDDKQKNTSAKQLAADFTWPDSLIDAFDREKPPINLTTPVRVALTLETKGVRSRWFKKSYALNNTVPVWKLTSEFMRVRKDAGIAPENPPPFIMIAEIIYPRTRGARIRTNGSSLKQMFADLKKLAASDLRFSRAPSGTFFQLSLFHGDRASDYFIQTGALGSVDVLYNQLQDKVEKTGFFTPKP